MKVLFLSDKVSGFDQLSAMFDETFQFERYVDPVEGQKHFISDKFDIVYYQLDFLSHPIKPLSDTFMELKKARPGVRIILLCEETQIKETIQLLRLGADGYLTMPCGPLEIKAQTEMTLAVERKTAELEALRDEFWNQDIVDIVKTNSIKMKSVFDMVKDVAPTSSTVLLNGETGVGKGVIAKLIHQHSNRRDKQFIHVHCGAMSENLVESELFGHEKGAFTGAVRRKLGKFELANGGTIFLDEISTLSLSAQIKLLQVMQDSIFQRVGGESDIRVNVRIIAATNEDLKHLSDSGAFRRDLFFRLNVFPIEVPPLRERLEDIEHIISVFLQKMRSLNVKQIEGVLPDTLKYLKSYSWPGNIRELENLLERAYIIEKTNMLTDGAFPLDVQQKLENRALLPLHLEMPLAEARAKSIEVFEKQYLAELLSQTKGRINATAQKAGISVRQLNNLMNKYGIVKEEFKTIPSVQR